MTSMLLCRISADDRYRLSYPLRPERFGEIAGNLPGWPLLVVDCQGRLIAGHDYLSWLRKRGRCRAPALELELTPKEALFFAFHWKRLLGGYSLYEKLRFLDKARHMADAREIRRRAPLDIPISEALLEKIELLLAPPFKTPLQRDALHLRPLQRLATARPGDQKAMIALVTKAAFNENQQLKIIELLEEISFRDRLSWQAILARISLQPLLARQMPQKAIIEALLRLRFPEYRRFLERWQKERAIPFASAGIQIRPHPFFEKEEVGLSMTCPNLEEAEKVLQTLKNALDR